MSYRGKRLRQGRHAKEMRDFTCGMMRLLGFVFVEQQ